MFLNVRSCSGYLLRTYYLIVMLQMTCMCTSETIIVLILVTDVHMYMQMATR